MLKNWPKPGSKVRLTKAIEVEGESIPAGSPAELRRYLVEKREREEPSDTFLISVQGKIAIVERSDIRLAE
jgi:hypothetical protein